MAPRGTAPCTTGSASPIRTNSATTKLTPGCSDSAWIRDARTPAPSTTIRRLNVSPPSVLPSSARTDTSSTVAMTVE